MAEGLALKVDLILSNLSKHDKRDDIEALLYNLTTAVSIIEETVSKLERNVSIFNSKFKSANHSVSKLKESPIFGEEEIVDVKKDACNLKENHLLTSEQFHKQILYLKCYSRRENLKFIGIPERIIFGQGIPDENEKTCKHIKAVIYEFLEEELDIEDPYQKSEFHHVHCLGRKDRNGPSPILARFLCCAYCKEVLQKASRKLKDTNFAVLEDILNDLFYPE